MNKTINLSLLFIILLLAFSAAKTLAQSNQAGYKDMIGENPDYDTDLKIVSDFMNSLTSGDLDKVKSLLSPDYKGYGPGPKDSANTEQTINTWKENYKVQSNRKIGFVSQTFRVLSGNLKGDWVSAWADYSFTQNGINITFPLQYTALIANGKIVMDRVYYDRLYILQTLGFKVTPPGK